MKVQILELAVELTFGQSKMLGSPADRVPAHEQAEHQNHHDLDCRRIFSKESRSKLDLQQ